MHSTDSMMGGRSVARLAVNDGALEVAGTVAPGLPFAWSGAMYTPAVTPFAPADLSGFTGIRFRVRGDGERYRLMLFSLASGQVPVARPFTAGAEWTEVTLPFAQFPGVSAASLQALIFAAGPGPRDFRFTIDDVRFVR